jgi:hypothetical protein
MSEPELLEFAWDIIANAGEGDWHKETPEWFDAATVWRENYFKWLKSRATSTSRWAAFSAKELSHLRGSIESAPLTKRCPICWSVIEEINAELASRKRDSKPGQPGGAY